MKRSSLFRFLPFLLPAALFTSCGEKDLCYDHSHLSDVEVVFDWSASPDASPSTMVAHFFTPDGKEYRRSEFTSRSGGRAHLDAGDYLVLFHNGEMETVVESGETYSDYILTCQMTTMLEPMGRTDLPPRPSHAADQRVAGVPERVWAGVGELVTIRHRDDNQKIVLTPEEKTIEYTIDFIDVENINTSIAVSAAITGMSDCYNLSRQTHCGQPVTMPLALERVGESTLRASFYAFGHCPVENLLHTVTVYTADNKYYNFDITDKIHSAENPRHIVVEIEGLKLPTPGGGMSTTVSGWNEIVNVDIPMN